MQNYSEARKFAEEVGVDAEWILGKLQENAELCLKPGRWRNPTAGNRALELLGKHIGLFPDKVEHSGKVDLVQNEDSNAAYNKRMKNARGNSGKNIKKGN